MDQLHHLAEELVGLRRFLERLESADTNLYRNNIDVTESEINILKHEIACLDRLFAGMKSKDNMKEPVKHADENLVSQMSRPTNHLLPFMRWHRQRFHRRNPPM